MVQDIPAFNTYCIAAKDAYVSPLSEEGIFHKGGDPPIQNG
jgi:hypothetical protein